MTTVRYLRFHRRDSPTVMVGLIAGLAMALSAAAAGGADSPAAPAATPPPAPKSAISKKVDATLKDGPAVVVGYLPNAVVDGLGLIEARAAAGSSGTPFIALNAGKKDHARELLTRFATTSTPTVMIVRPNGKIETQLSGYADRETVAQAIRNARQ